MSTQRLPDEVLVKFVQRTIPSPESGEWIRIPVLAREATLYFTNLLAQDSDLQQVYNPYISPDRVRKAIATISDNGLPYPLVYGNAGIRYSDKRDEYVPVINRRGKTIITLIRRTLTRLTRPYMKMMGATPQQMERADRAFTRVAETIADLFAELEEKA
jgi:hypothetical protein